MQINVNLEEPKPPPIKDYDIVGISPELFKALETAFGMLYPDDLHIPQRSQVWVEFTGMRALMGEWLRENRRPR